jgi:hypothetical protein
MATSAKTPKAPTRIMDTDPKTGKRYVKTTTIEGATVTAVKFVGVMTGDKYSWSSATYDVTSPPPASELFAGAIKWDGKTFKVGNKPAPSLGKAVRAVLGIEALPAPKPPATKKDTTPKDSTPPPATGGSKRKSAAQRKADKAAADLAAAEAAAASGSSIIVKDPETGLPAIDPETQAKADAIVAEQVAKNEAADAEAQAQYEAEQQAAQDAAVERITSGETTVEGEVIDILTRKGTK